jgi:hypothetical protein
MAHSPAPLPDVLPGEDRSYGAGLFVDLIPKSSWFDNVRAAVDPADWDRLRHHVYRRAGYRCEACRTNRFRLEAHERFAYEAQAGVQRLVRLICLCHWCHTATHMGLAGLRGVQDQALAHLMTVTGMNPAEANEHVSEAFARWERRSQIPWHVDLSMIAAARIGLRVAPQRRAPKPEETPPLGILVVTTVTSFAVPVAPAHREPSDAEQALAASYERYADQLAEIEALRSGRLATASLRQDVLKGAVPQRRYRKGV